MLLSCQYVIHRTVASTLCSLLLLCSFGSEAATILDYPNIVTGQVSASEIASPATVFHSQEEADREATKILDAWKNEPLTIPWTRVQLDRYVKHKMMPTRGARGLALVHVAMYDAYQLAIQQRVSAKLAVSMAAAQVLAYLFPAEEKAFDRIAFCIAARMYDVRPDAIPGHVLLAMAVGKRVGDRVIQYAELDGAQRGWNGVRLQWYGEGRYYGPGAWEPTPPYFYYPPDEPFAPTWKPWILKSAGEFRPTPPEFASSSYVQELREVVSIAAALTADQLAIAKFWVDGHGSITPPGHWNRIAIEEVTKAPLDDAKTAELFASLNVALADTFIAVWECKYHYWTMRPVTAAKYVLGIDLKTAVLTPPFPSYVSGHAAFSGAAAKVIGSYFPNNAQNLDAMANEAAMSRLLGGIHFRHDNDDGLMLGRKVASEVLRQAATNRDASVTRVLLD